MEFRYRAAEEALRASAVTGASICEPLRLAFDVDDVAITTLGPPFEAELVCAAGPFAQAFGQLQIDLGQGPAWDAVATGRPVLVQHVASGRWPLLADRMSDMPIESVYAFPVHAGALEVGALSLCSSSARRLEEHQLVAAAALVPLAGTAVLARALGATEVESAASPRSFLRGVHQATGMVAAQLRVTPDDALLAIRAHAFSTGRPVMDVARDLVERRLDLSAE